MPVIRGVKSNMPCAGSLRAISFVGFTLVHVSDFFGEADLSIFIPAHDTAIYCCLVLQKYMDDILIQTRQNFHLRTNPGPNKVPIKIIIIFLVPRTLIVV